MLPTMVDVFRGGAVRLGSNLACDGFISECRFRVQTHIHEDHMNHFNRSKGLQDIFLSPETFALLVSEFNAELEYRSNIHQIQRGNKFELDDGSMLRLLPSNHMLGSCQVELQLPDGYRVGYSGDFGWPLDEVIEIEELVVDSTYGSPDSVRRYTQAEAEECLMTLVSQRLRYGPVHIKAHRGTIERVLHVLEGNIDIPILASDRLIREVKIHQHFGLAPGTLVRFDSEDGRHVLRVGSYVRLYSKGDGFDNERIVETNIACSAFMTGSDHPLMKYSEKTYRVALSNHADFKETLAYIRATGAKKIVTDNTRTRGIQLANEINRRLPGVHARPSSNEERARWS